MQIDDTKRLDALLTLNVEIWPADNGDWLLLDFRETPPRTTEHKTGRDAIDAAMSPLAEAKLVPTTPQQSPSPG